MLSLQKRSEKEKIKAIKCSRKLKLFKNEEDKYKILILRILRLYNSFFANNKLNVLWQLDKTT